MRSSFLLQQRPRQQMPEKYIFTFQGHKEVRPSSSRKIHVRRLNDLMHLSIERGEYAHARRAWSILLRCKEFDWRTMWKTGLLLVSPRENNGGKIDEEELDSRISYLRASMLQVSGSVSRHFLQHSRLLTNGFSDSEKAFCKSLSYIFVKGDDFTKLSASFYCLLTQTCSRLFPHLNCSF